MYIYLDIRQHIPLMSRQHLPHFSDKQGGASPEHSDLGGGGCQVLSTKGKEIPTERMTKKGSRDQPYGPRSGSEATPRWGPGANPLEILNHFYKITGIKIKHLTIFKAFNGQ